LCKHQHKTRDPKLKIFFHSKLLVFTNLRPIELMVVWFTLFRHERIELVLTPDVVKNIFRTYLGLIAQCLKYVPVIN